MPEVELTKEDEHPDNETLVGILEEEQEEQIDPELLARATEIAEQEKQTEYVALNTELEQTSDEELVRKHVYGEHRDLVSVEFYTAYKNGQCTPDAIARKAQHIREEFHTEIPF